MMRFKKDGGREKKTDWWCRGKRIEEIMCYRYLGFIFQKNDGRKMYVKDRVRKRAVLRQVWGIGQKK